jgi:hypothetical protein
MLNHRTLGRYGEHIGNDRHLIALALAHLTSWTGRLERTLAQGHVVRRCPEASRSTAANLDQRQRDDSRRGLAAADMRTARALLDSLPQRLP